METVSVLVFFFFLLVVVEARSTNQELFSCEQFSCGGHDYQFPFFSTSMLPQCGLFKMKCVGKVSEIELEQNSGIWYEVKNVSQANTITITDPRINQGDGSCRDLSSFSLPNSPWFKDNLTTLSKCDNTGKNGLTYANCSAGNSSYYFSKEDGQNVSACSSIKIPQSWVASGNNSQIDVTATFSLHIAYPRGCRRCLLLGGKCTMYKEVEFRCDGGTKDNSEDSGIGTAAVVGVSIGVVVVLLSLIGVVVWCLKRRKQRLSALRGGYIKPTPMDSSPISDSALLKTQSSALLVGQSKKRFSYVELIKATNGFVDENLLGEGGFGRVYKGVLPDGRLVAVKQLKIGGGQGDREFKAEAETISRVHHRNLLSMVGYCISENQRLLIYDYVPNNNLHFHLHAAGTPGLDWEKRVKIASGVARGLAYLHEDCHPRILHRDIKSSNILLEDNFHALVADFGLSKLVLDCNTHITTRVMGTFGYLAPEYASSGKLTEKSDVFSFGVVLLELITGRKPVDTSQTLGEEGLVEWARPLLIRAIETEDFKAIADPKLGENYVDAEMFRMIEAAAACIRHSAAKRPRMSQIVRAFDSLAKEDLTNGMRLGENEIINSAQQSAEIRLFRRMAFGGQNSMDEQDEK